MAANTNKRKRSSLEQADSGRTAPGFQKSVSTTQQESTNPGMEPYPALDDAGVSQLLAHNNSEHGLHQNGGNNQSATDTAAAALQYHHGLPGNPDVSFQSQPVGDNSASFLGDQSSFMESLKENAQHPGQAPASASKSPTAPNSSQKPPVGSDEWHKVRRDNHKEGEHCTCPVELIIGLANTPPTVERRRRETINEGINELSKIVPGCEKNKGSILQRAVQYITQLKENENQNIEKWTLEKLLLDQAITELSASCDRLKADCQRAYTELEIWKKAAQNAGILPDEIKNRDDGDEQAVEG
jgi:transcriptional regulator CBF1